VIDGTVVRGLGGITWGAGFALRFLQVGNLQAYAFLFGAGVVLLLYFILFGTK
jgi:NADH-quinone oxidoreductase subunit L